VTFEVRRTHHGNVVNDLLDGVQPGEVYALMTSATAAERSSLEGALKMMRASDWASFREAMSQYASPAPLIIYADDQNNIGYHTLVQTPVRPTVQRLPREGWTGEDEWTMIPFELMPSMLNPLSGQIYTANQLPAGSWYPYPLGPARGIGPRAERLSEIFSREGKFSVEDFLTEVHRDSVNPTLRDFVILALAVMAEDGAADPVLEEALAKLEAWDFRLAVDQPAYSMASGILKALETEGVAEIWKMGYAGTEEGPSYMFREFMPQYRETGKVPQNPELRAWLKEYLLKGIALAPSFDADVTNGGHIHSMPYQNNWLGLGSFAPEHDLDSPPLEVSAIQTLWSPVGQNYAQIVDFSDLDLSQSLNPPGISENPSSPHFKDQLEIWSRGELHPAPITRAGVEKVRESTTWLVYAPPGDVH
ncbi:MAG: penicillin acylase family protein, partial [Pseudomonadales bacterium]